MYQILLKATLPLAIVLLLAVMACGSDAEPTPVRESQQQAPTSAPRSQATTAPAAAGPAGADGLLELPRSSSP